MSHLKSVRSSYIKHFFYASYYNFLAVLIVITGIIHSIFPFWFAFTPYKLAKKIVEGTEKNFCNKKGAALETTNSAPRLFLNINCFNSTPPKMLMLIFVTLSYFLLLFAKDLRLLDYVC